MKRTFLIISLLLISMFLLSACGGTSLKKEWSSEKLGALLPVPVSKKIEISVDSDTLFQAEIYNFSKDDYKAYMDECIEKGFSSKIIESNSGTSIGNNSDNVTDSFSASNADGYALEIHYKGTLKQMDVILSK